MEDFIILVEEMDKLASALERFEALPDSDEPPKYTRAHLIALLKVYATSSSALQIFAKMMDDISKRESNVKELIAREVKEKGSISKERMMEIIQSQGPDANKLMPKEQEEVKQEKPEGQKFIVIPYLQTRIKS